MEEYIRIKEFPKYAISNLGRVKRIDNGKIRKNMYQRGYASVSFHLEKRFYKKSIHRLVAMAFIPNPEDKPCVNHINGVKDDNRLDNLEWCTYGENIKHAYDNGLRPNRVGEEKANSKLTLKQVIELLEYKRDLDVNKKMPIKYFANKFKVSRPTINSVLSRANWGHVKINNNKF